jgi:hypothetical protein
MRCTYREIVRKGDLEELTRRKIKDLLTSEEYNFEEDKITEQKDFFKKTIDEAINA